MLRNFTVNAETAGIEIELENPVITGREKCPEGFQFTNDASVQTPIKFIEGINLAMNNSDGTEKLFRLVPYQSMTAGTELVSRIINTSEEPAKIKDMLNEVCDFALTKGENYYGSERCGIHFHISQSNTSVRQLKNLVKLWVSMEDLIYTLSGVGTTFRGEKNNSTYARPITGNGIFIPHGNSRWAQLIELPKLLATNSSKEFYLAWGDSLTQHREHYHPVRYYGLNLSSNLYKGTTEFRPMNVVLNPEWIIAMMEFFRKMVEVSITYSSTTGMKKGFPFSGENSIYNPRDKNDMYNSLVDFWKTSEGDDKTFYHLERILSLTGIPKIDSRPIRTHLSRRSQIRPHWREGDYSPSVYLNPDEVSLPNFTDIHTLRGE